MQWEYRLVRRTFPRSRGSRQVGRRTSTAYGVTVHSQEDPPLERSVLYLAEGFRRTELHYYCYPVR